MTETGVDGLSNCVRHMLDFASNSYKGHDPKYRRTIGVKKPAHPYYFEPFIPARHVPNAHRRVPRKAKPWLMLTFVQSIPTMTIVRSCCRLNWTMKIQVNPFWYQQYQDRMEYMLLNAPKLYQPYWSQPCVTFLLTNVIDSKMRSLTRFTCFARQLSSLNFSR